MSIRHRAQQYRVENGLPAEDGYVIFYHGQPGGWVDGLSPDNARNWKNGCIAVPGKFNAPMFTSIGDDDFGWGGSASWEKVDPVFEAKGLL